MAKLRYMVDRKAVIENGAVKGYEPIGVWVQTVPNGLDVYFVDGTDPYEQDGWQVINRLVEQEESIIPDGFLEYHRDTQSAYHGSRGPVTDTEQYSSADACGAAILAKIAAGEIS